MKTQTQKPLGIAVSPLVYGQINESERAYSSQHLADVLLQSYRKKPANPTKQVFFQAPASKRASGATRAANAAEFPLEARLEPPLRGSYSEASSSQRSSPTTCASSTGLSASSDLRSSGARYPLLPALQWFFPRPAAPAAILPPPPVVVEAHPIPQALAGISTAPLPSPRASRVLAGPPSSPALALPLPSPPLPPGTGYCRRSRSSHLS